MPKHAVFNQSRLTSLTAALLCVKTVFAFPRYLFETSGNAAWLEAIYIFAAAYAMLELSMLFYRFTGNKNILSLSESIGGMPLKITVALLVVLCFSVSLSAQVRIFAESVKLILLPKSRIEYIFLLFAAAVAVGSMHGLDAVATVNGIFFPFCAAFLLILCISLLKYCNPNNLFPIFGKGADRLFVGGLSDLSCFSDILALNLLLPHTADIAVVRKSGRRAMLAAGGAITLICLVYGMLYPYPYTAEFFLTAYQMSRMVRVGEYFHRFEAMFEFVWAITHLLYSSIYLCLIAETLGDVFKLRGSNAAIPCITAIICFAAAEPASVAALLDISKKINVYLLPAAYFLPVIIPCAYIVLRRNKS